MHFTGGMLKMNERKQIHIFLKKGKSLFKARKVTLFKQNLGTNVLNEILMDLEGCVAVYGCVHVHSV